MFEFDSKEWIENQRKRKREREDKSGGEAVIDRQRKEFFLVEKLIFLLSLPIRIFFSYSIS